MQQKQVITQRKILCYPCLNEKEVNIQYNIGNFLKYQLQLNILLINTRYGRVDTTNVGRLQIQHHTGKYNHCCVFGHGCVGIYTLFKKQIKNGHAWTKEYLMHELKITRIRINTTLST